jgi:hypothetical protein
LQACSSTAHCTFEAHSTQAEQAPLPSHGAPLLELLELVDPLPPLPLPLVELDGPRMHAVLTSGATASQKSECFTTELSHSRSGSASLRPAASSTRRMSLGLRPSGD